MNDDINNPRQDSPPQVAGTNLDYYQNYHLGHSDKAFDELMPFFIAKFGNDYKDGIRDSLTKSDNIVDEKFLKDKLLYSKEKSSQSLFKESWITMLIETKGRSLSKDPTAPTQLEEAETLGKISLNLVEVRLNSDISNILAGLKKPGGKPYLLSLAGKAKGPKDLSQNKRKYY